MKEKPQKKAVQKKGKKRAKGGGSRGRKGRVEEDESALPKKARREKRPPSPGVIRPPCSSCKSARTILVAGLSPESFRDELTRIWPKVPPPVTKLRMVWLNSFDAPPKLPGEWVWHEVHRTKAEDLLSGDVATQNWGQVFVIMGAGTSVQNFTLLKTSAVYPFEKEMLQACADVDVIDQSASLHEPLCFITLRFMAGLRKAYLEKHVPPFHCWLRQLADAKRLHGVLTFNIDSLEFLALEPTTLREGGRVIQFHGNITQLTTIDSLSAPYSTRKVVDATPAVWADPDALHRLATSRATFAEVALEADSGVFMGSGTGTRGPLSTTATDTHAHTHTISNGSPTHRPKRCAAMSADDIADAAFRLAGGKTPSPATTTLSRMSSTATTSSACSSSEEPGGSTPSSTSTSSSTSSPSNGETDTPAPPSSSPSRPRKAIKDSLSKFDMQRVNHFLRSRVRELYVGNCVYTGEQGDAKIGRAATGFLKAFVGGETDFDRLEREVRDVNCKRGAPLASPDRRMARQEKLKKEKEQQAAADTTDDEDEWVLEESEDEGGGGGGGWKREGDDDDNDCSASVASLLMPLLPQRLDPTLAREAEKLFAESPERRRITHATHTHAHSLPHTHAHTHTHTLKRPRTLPVGRATDAIHTSSQRSPFKQRGLCGGSGTPRSLVGVGGGGQGSDVGSLMHAPLASPLPPSHSMSAALPPLQMLLLSNHYQQEQQQQKQQRDVVVGHGSPTKRQKKTACGVGTVHDMLDASKVKHEGRVGCEVGSQQQQQQAANAHSSPPQQQQRRPRLFLKRQDLSDPQMSLQLSFSPRPSPPPHHLQHRQQQLHHHQQQQAHSSVSVASLHSAALVLQNPLPQQQHHHMGAPPVKQDARHTHHPSQPQQQQPQPQQHHHHHNSHAHSNPQQPASRSLSSFSQPPPPPSRSSPSPPWPAWQRPSPSNTSSQPPQPPQQQQQQHSLHFSHNHDHQQGGQSRPLLYSPREQASHSKWLPQSPPTSHPTHSAVHSLSSSHACRQIMSGDTDAGGELCMNSIGGAGRGGGGGGIYNSRNGGNGGGGSGGGGGGAGSSDGDHGSHRFDNALTSRVNVPLHGTTAMELLLLQDHHGGARVAHSHAHTHAHADAYPRTNTNVSNGGLRAMLTAALACHRSVGGLSLPGVEDMFGGDAEAAAASALTRDRGGGGGGGGLRGYAESVERRRMASVGGNAYFVCACGGVSVNGVPCACTLSRTSVSADGHKWGNTTATGAPSTRPRLPHAHDHPFPQHTALPSTPYTHTHTHTHTTHGHTGARSTGSLPPALPMDSSKSLPSASLGEYARPLAYTHPTHTHPHTHTMYASHHTTYASPWV